MELWIRSTAKTNLLQVRFLTIMDGKTFYKKDEWEFKGYTICNCTEQGNYEILGTYKTKERALEVLDEIQTILRGKYATSFDYKVSLNGFKKEEVEQMLEQMAVYEMPED